MVWNGFDILVGGFSEDRWFLRGAGSREGVVVDSVIFEGDFSRVVSWDF